MPSKQATGPPRGSARKAPSGAPTRKNPMRAARPSSRTASEYGSDNSEDGAQGPPLTAVTEEQEMTTPVTPPPRPRLGSEGGGREGGQGNSSLGPTQAVTAPSEAVTTTADKPSDIRTAATDTASAASIQADIRERATGLHPDLVVFVQMLYGMLVAASKGMVPPVSEVIQLAQAVDPRVCGVFGEVEADVPDSVQKMSDFVSSPLWTL